MSIAAGKWGSKRAEGKNWRPRRQTSASGQRTTLRMENIETWVGVCREVFTPDTVSINAYPCMYEVVCFYACEGLGLTQIN